MAYYPGVYNITLFRGTTLRQSFVRKQSINGPVFNLSGYGVQGQVYANKSPELGQPPLIALAVSTGELSLNALAGQVDLYLASNVVTSLLNSQKTYYYNIQLVAPNTDVIPFISGSITIVQSAVR